MSRSNKFFPFTVGYLIDFIECWEEGTGQKVKTVVYCTAWNTTTQTLRILNNQRSWLTKRKIRLCFRKSTNDKEGEIYFNSEMFPFANIHLNVEFNQPTSQKDDYVLHNGFLNSL